MTARMSQSSSRTLVPSRNVALSSPLAYHPLSTSLAGSLPLNVLLFGGTGVGKSAIINLITGRDVAQTSSDPTIPKFEYTPYEVNLGGRRFKLWEVSLLKSASSFWTLPEKRRLKQWYKKLYKDDGVYLLLYCMRGSRAQRASTKDYKLFTDIVGSTARPGRVPVAAVVTSLEDYPRSMDNWWTNNKDNLEHLGMRFSAHACITSLPHEPNASPMVRARRQRSEQAIRSLIHDSYQAGAETPRSSSVALP